MARQEQAKQRILDASIELFAQKGFAGVGVREISQKADVNIAMISYYFDGKIGVLKEIISCFFDGYQEALMQIDSEKGFNSRVDSLVKTVISFFRSNRSLARVAFVELPIELPEIAEFKGERIKEIISIVQKNIFTEIGNEIKIDQLAIIGPALMSMMMSNFLLAPVVKNAFGLDFSDEFFDQYEKTLSKLLNNGLSAFV